MKSMPIGSALKPSYSSSSPPSLRPPLVASAFESCHEKVEVSRVQVWKSVRLRHSTVKSWRLNDIRSRKLNDPQIATQSYKRFDGHETRRTKVPATATFTASEFSHDSHGSTDVLSKINGKSLGATMDVIYRFAKAYTLQGAAMSIISASLLAVDKLSDFSPSFFIGLLQAIIGGALANSYVAGINQLSDIEIDKVNKPHLPLPSGQLSVKAAIQLTSLYAILGFCLGWSIESWPLKLGLFLWYAFGTAYSVHLPLLRWKRNPLLAAMSISAGQGPIVHILFHLHARTCTYGRPLILSKHAIFVSGMMSIFGIVAALFKDIPDIEGDKINGVNSLASQLGIRTVFWLCVWLLEMTYGVAILVGLSSTRFWAKSIMVLGHSILGFILWRKANLVDLESNEAIESFYMFMWKLYGVEYMLVPFLRF